MTQPTDTAAAENDMDPEDRAANHSERWMRQSFPNSPMFHNRVMSLKAMLMRFYEDGADQLTAANERADMAEKRVSELEAAK